MEDYDWRHWLILVTSLVELVGYWLICTKRRSGLLVMAFVGLAMWITSVVVYQRSWGDPVMYAYPIGIGIFLYGYFVGWTKKGARRW